MKSKYDRDADAMYITLATPATPSDPTKPPIESEEVRPNVFLDFDQSGKLVGIEILYASETVGTNFHPKLVAAE